MYETRWSSEEKFAIRNHNVGAFPPFHRSPVYYDLEETRFAVEETMKEKKNNVHARRMSKDRNIPWSINFYLPEQ